MFLACYFAHLPTGPPARSVFRLHNPRNGLPRSRLLPCLKPVACRYLPASLAALSVSTPLRGFSPLWIEAFNECRCLPVHLPNPPDSRSLPEAFSITRCQLRITVPSSLRFRRLAVPAFASHDLCIQSWMTQKGRVSPFGHLWIKARLPAPHNFSQATASFIACDRQGIHHMHLFA